MLAHELKKFFWGGGGETEDFKRHNFRLGMY